MNHMLAPLERLVMASRKKEMRLKTTESGFEATELPHVGLSLLFQPVTHTVMLLNHCACLGEDILLGYEQNNI